ncbi:MAG: hypothetical protein PHD11_00575 [Bacteroidales bacterium]|nr:hypothetical protein [Bacteroidales bacterium]MDD4670666.1 hypothetical protein [Bacteroidales bacterium]
MESLQKHDYDEDDYIYSRRRERLDRQIGIAVLCLIILAIIVVIMLLIFQIICTRKYL